MKQNNRPHSAGAVQRTEQQIKALLKLYYSTPGITIKQFCQRHNIAQGSFYGWHKRYRKELSATNSGIYSAFIPLQLNAAPANNTPLPALFAQVGPISIYQPVSAQFLKTLLP